MKIVVAMDSFKGSLRSMEAGYAVRDGIRRACAAEIIVKPVADGGEGTTEALVEGLGGEYREAEVTGPLGTCVRARYGILPDGKTAVMEMAEAAGMALLKGEKPQPLWASTYGVGEMIEDAVNNGCRDFIVGIGGSATVDGGTGMLKALGYAFSDRRGDAIGPGIQDLDKIAEIKLDCALPELKDCHFMIACDVVNPLCGENGAIYIYGPQKGVKEQEKARFDLKMRHFADMTRKFTGSDYGGREGAGAAGGLGFAFMSYLPHVEMKSGISLALDAVHLEECLKDADYVITGEGRMDAQTVMGKVPAGVARLAKKYKKKVIAFAGEVTETAEACHAAGIDAIFPVIREITTREEAMRADAAKRNIQAAEQVFRLLV